VLDIPVLKITQQYMEYIELMESLRMELAAEYLVMAAMLAEIKSRMLLPRQTHEDAEDDDPRADLVRRLLEYERYKRAAEDLDQLPRLNRDHFQTRIPLPENQLVRPLPSVELNDVLIAFKEVLRRAEQSRHHHIQREALSVRERMSNILDRLHHASGQYIAFHQFFSLNEGKQGAVVTLLAILELCKEGLLDIVQNEPLSELWVKPVTEA
jgi:segregation and condensation protein A